MWLPSGGRLENFSMRRDPEHREPGWVPAWGPLRSSRWALDICRRLAVLLTRQSPAGRSTVVIIMKQEERDRSQPLKGPSEQGSWGAQNPEKPLRPTSPFLGARASPPPPLTVTSTSFTEPLWNHLSSRPKAFLVQACLTAVRPDAREIWVPVTQVTWFQTLTVRGRTEVA